MFRWTNTNTIYKVFSRHGYNIRCFTNITEKILMSSSVIKLSCFIGWWIGVTSPGKRKDARMIVRKPRSYSSHIFLINPYQVILCLSFFSHFSVMQFIIFNRNRHSLHDGTGPYTTALTMGVWGELVTTGKEAIWTWPWPLLLLLILCRIIFFT